jgi:NAD(P)-dependent dehydrogenase (short-subunit alcohol dehydrogenase family)
MYNGWVYMIYHVVGGSEVGNKVALVTGGSRGIGRASALALADAGYDVGINYRSSEDKAHEVCELIRAKGMHTASFQANVAAVEEINSLFDRFLAEFDHIDLLVNNAGITRGAPFLKMSERMWDDITSTDWKGAYFCAQRAAQSMVEKQIKGVIINITSNQQDGCWPYSSVYGPTKAAVAKFTRHAALELSKYGIRVNAVAPGYTTSAERSMMPGKINSRLPLGRFATYEEIANAVVFLASDGASYMTGSCLNIDGGSLLPIVPENDYL